MSSEEKILVIPADVIDAIGTIDGYEPDGERYLSSILTSERLSFRPRSAMESDPSFKQLIPYVLLQWNDKDGQPHIFTYVRGGGGGEARLHAKWSVGIGGHISAEDARGKGDAYTVGMQREIDEEVTIGTTYGSERLGLIYDPSSDVGRVHLGVVHRFLLDAPEVSSNEADLADGQFRSIDDLRHNIERLETWSCLAIEAIFPITGV